MFHSSSTASSEATEVGADRYMECDINKKGVLFDFHLDLKSKETLDAVFSACLQAGCEHVKREQIHASVYESFLGFVQKGKTPAAKYLISVVFRKLHRKLVESFEFQDKEISALVNMALKNKSSSTCEILFAV